MYLTQIKESQCLMLAGEYYGRNSERPDIRRYRRDNT